MEKPISPLKRFFNLLKVDRQDIFSIYVYAIFNGLIALSLPLGIQAIINFIISGEVTTSWIMLMIFVIGGVALMGLMQIMQLTLSENLQQKIFTRSAFEFAYRIPRLKIEAVENQYIPELVNRFFDTLSVQKGLSKIILDFSSATLQVIFGLILLSFYHSFFIFFSLLLILLVYLIFRFTGPKGLKSSIDESKYKYEVAHWLEEVARTMETFKLSGYTDLPLKRIDEKVSGYLKARKSHFRTLRFQFINLIGFKVIITAGLLLIGGLLVINEQMNIGQFVAAEIIIILILASVEKLILSMETIYDVLTALEKIGNVTDLPLEKEEGNSGTHKNRPSLSVNIQELHYRFPDASEPALKDVNLQIKAGEKICLSGYSGSGKSLLLQILAGLYEDYDGSVSLNEIPLANWNKAELRQIVSDNLNKEDIFKGTIEENISLGRPEISMERVREAAEILGLHSYVERLPRAYQTILQPEGSNIPKSYRLRVILARCLAVDAHMILIEDNLAPLAEKDRQAFLDHLMQRECTVIIKSNNPEIAGRMQRTVVMNRGLVIRQGAVAEFTAEEWYKQIFKNS